MVVRPKKPEHQVKEDVWIPTTCDMCYCSCTLNVHKVDGVITKITGIEEAPPNYGKICAKGNSAMMNLYNPRRITRPLRRRNPEKGMHVDPQFEEISWDEAWGILEAEMRRTREEDPRKLIVASFDTYSFAPLRAFMSAFGSPNFTAGPAGYFCGNGVHPVAYTFTGSHDMHPDLKYGKLAIFFGASFGFVGNSNAMPLTMEMAEARERGMKLIVINPQLSYAASQADEWVPILPGTDAALALGMMYVLVHELNLFDREAVKRYTNGGYLVSADGHYVRHAESKKPLLWDPTQGRALEYDDPSIKDCALTGEYTVQGQKCSPAFVALMERLQEYTPDRVEKITTVPAATVRRLAKEFGEAAQIGSTIHVGGVELPYRPASASWYRGATAHSHGMLNGLTLATLNALVGSLDVPGGLINANAAGPFGGPYAGLDGILTVGNRYSHMKPPYPPSPVKKPQTAELVELFPVAVYARAMLWLGVLEPERFKLDYQPDTLIVCRTNLMTNTGDPHIMAEALQKMRFICAMADHHNETTAFADLILPDSHFLERLVPLTMSPFTQFRAVPMPGGEWGYNLQQPVVKPMGESRYWIETMIELGDRLDLTPDLYASFNAVAHLEGENRLDPDKRYTWEEICDRWTRSWLGEEHGLDYLKEKGYHVIGPRTPQESYPRPFHTGRVPVYFEHYLAAGESVKQVTESMGIKDWDISDYQTVVSWKPCPSYDRSKDPEFDLFAVNSKLPFFTFTFSAENPWLTDLVKRNEKVFNVGMNPETAKRKRLRDGDAILLESPEGNKARGVIRITEGIHPQCVSIPGIFGRWGTQNPEMQGKGVHFNSFIQYTFDRMDKVSAALDSCVRLKITKA